MKLSKEMKGLAEYHDAQGHDSTARMVRRCIPILEKHEKALAKAKAKKS